MRIGKEVVSGVCDNCKWRTDDVDNGLDKCREHAKKFKHIVNAEVVVLYNYDYSPRATGEK